MSMLFFSLTVNPIFTEISAANQPNMNRIFGDLNFMAIDSCVYFWLDDASKLVAHFKGCTAASFFYALA